LASSLVLGIMEQEFLERLQLTTILSKKELAEIITQFHLHNLAEIEVQCRPIFIEITCEMWQVILAEYRQFYLEKLNIMYNKSD